LEARGVAVIEVPPYQGILGAGTAGYVKEEKTVYISSAAKGKRRQWALWHEAAHVADYKHASFSFEYGAVSLRLKTALLAHKEFLVRLHTRGPRLSEAFIATLPSAAQLLIQLEREREMILQRTIRMQPCELFADATACLFCCHRLFFKRAGGLFHPLSKELRRYRFPLEDLIDTRLDDVRA